MNGHRQLIADLPALNEDNDQIQEKGPSPREEFSFQGPDDGTITDHSISQVSSASRNPRWAKVHKYTTCPDCGYAGRYPSEVTRHRGKSDVCAELRILQKNKKKN